MTGREGDQEVEGGREETDLVLEPYRDEPVKRAPSLDDLEPGLACAQRQCRHEACKTNQQT